MAWLLLGYTVIRSFPPYLALNLISYTDVYSDTLTHFPYKTQNNMKRRIWDIFILSLLQITNSINIQMEINDNKVGMVCVLASEWLCIWNI